MNAPQGRCYWAAAPFAPNSPFRVYAGEEHPPIETTTQQIVAAARAGDPQLTVLVEVKARPMLVLTPTLDPYDDVLALRLRRLAKESPGNAARIRAQQDDGLFYLDPAAFPHLPAENAAIITALLRLPSSALDTSRELGVLSVNDLRVIHERVARAHELNLDTLVLNQAQRLLETLKGE